MRLGRRLVLLTAATALLGSALAATAAASPAAYAAMTGAPAATRAQAMSAAAEQGNAGWVRYANLSQGTPEDVYLYSFGSPQNQTVLMHQGYGGVSSYMELSAGEYTVAVRPVGTAASSPASFMVSAGTNYTVASLGRRLQVLQDQIAAPSGEALVRVIQASSKQPRVTVSIGTDTLARELTLGSVTAYQAVAAGTPSVVFSTPDGHAATPVTLVAGSVHTIVVLDGTSGLKIDNLTDGAGGRWLARATSRASRIPALAMVAASAVTARPGPMPAASADVAAAARPATPFCPADPSALIRPRSASGMACWTMVPAMTWVAARHSDAPARRKRARANEGPTANAAIPAPAPAKAMPMVTAPRPAAGNMDRPRPTSMAAMPGAIRSRP
jgi:hypothetical protein